MGISTWQRLDWRFLLPAPLSGRIAVFGEVAGVELLPQLPGVREVDLAPRDSGYDAAILGPAASLASGLAALAPSGIAYQQRPPGSALSNVWWRPPATARIWWHAPSRAATSYLAARDDRVALRQLMGRHHGVPLGRMKSYAARGLIACGATALLARDVSVVASPRGDQPPASWSTVASPGASALLVTPRFAASRHVIALLTPTGAAHPELVVKMPRQPGDAGGIRVEHAALTILAHTAPALAGRIPAPVALHDGPDRTMLVETAVNGPPLDPERVRRHPALAVAQAMDLVDRLPVTGRTGSDPDWFGRLLARPLQRFADTGALHGEAAAVVAATRRLLAPLQNADLPLVAVHGDLSHPNLVVRPDDSIGAVDWERSTLAGLPGTDAIFVMQYLGEARRGVFDRAAQRRVLDEDLLAPAGSGRTAVERHLAGHGVDHEIYPALLVACWTQAACSLLERLGIGSRSERDRLLAADRDVCLWQHAVTRLAATA